MNNNGNFQLVQYYFSKRIKIAQDEFVDIKWEWNSSVVDQPVPLDDCATVASFHQIIIEKLLALFGQSLKFQIKHKINERNN